MAILQLQEDTMLYREQEKNALKRFDDRKDKREQTVDTLKAKTPLDIDSEQRIKVRRSLLDSRDGMSLERILGKSDIFPISYFETGLNISSSICRIEIHDRIGRVLGYGTGFMVSPVLLLTNNHVIEDIETARYGIAQFNYQTSLDLTPCPAKSFRFDPDRFFLTHEYLDFSLVAVENQAAENANLGEFGFLGLIFQSGKALIGEYLTIIQHPLGGPKSVTIRENRVLDIFDDFIHYAADTSEGSSGSPVFNDNWDIVGIHHASIPDPENRRNFVANEGIRISSIGKYLVSKRSESSLPQRELLDQLLTPDSRKETIEVPREPMVTEEPAIESYSHMSGYDPDFLGCDYSVPLPKPGHHIEQDIALLHDGGRELTYTHFSIVMSASRRLALYCAVNVDGGDLVNIKRGNDRWYFDSRIGRQFQSGPQLYRNNDLDRGHLVRRIDPVWGDDASIANENTFHFTNCAPQHKNLNQRIWSDLEDYILRNADLHNLKISVFTGPVFRADDMLYRGEFQIPAEFWKIVVMVTKKGNLSATAYLQTQKNLLTNLEFAYGSYKTYQVSVEKIESLTDLHFSSLYENEPIRMKTQFARLIEKPGDLEIA